MAKFTQFATFPIFFHQSGSEWLRMANFAQFATFSIFSHRSGLEWLGMANFAWYATFPIFPNWSGSEWLSQFQPICNFCDQSISFLQKCQNFSILGEEHQQFFWVFQMFWIVSHKSGSKWHMMINFAKKVANFGWKILEKLPIRWNWPFWVILSHFGGKRLEKLWLRAKLAILSHSEPLWWEKIGKGCELGEIGHSESFWAHSGGLRLEKLANRAKLAILIFGLRLTFWWSAGLVNGLKPHPPTPLQSKKKRNAHFGLRSTSGDQPGCLMDLNPFCPLQYKESWILSELQLLQSFPTEVAWNGQFHPICNFSNLFPQKRLRMTQQQPILPDSTTFSTFSHQSGSEWLGTANFAWFATLSNLLPPKWLR